MLEIFVTHGSEHLEGSIALLALSWGEEEWG
jgi:hypothetical protein